MIGARLQRALVRLAARGGLARARVQDGTMLYKAGPEAFPARLQIPVFASASRYLKTLTLTLTLLLLGFAGGIAQAATPPDTRIQNTAQLTYHVNGGARAYLAESNAVEVLSTLPVFTPGEVSLLRYGGAAPQSVATDISGTRCEQAGSGSFLALPGNLVMPGVGELNGSSLPAAVTDTFHVGEPLFVQVEDADHNLDPAARERVDVTLTVEATGDEEHLSLLETDTNTGVFAGAIQTLREPRTPLDCRLAVDVQSEIVARYDDYRSVQTSVSVLVDPFGVLFDSVTGQPVDGATVRFIDTASGEPAEVFGDDGVSAYPATVTSGGGTTDASGASYNFPPGEYRFPYARPGTYRLVVEPPPGYTWPSQASDADIAVLPGAPYAMANGSRGEQFVINPGPALHIDIPLDPVSTALFVRKTASTASAGIGDFVQYRVETENTDLVPARNAVLTDVLPPGLRYVQGSAKLDGAVLADPAISPDGRRLEFAIGNVPAGATVALSYVIEIAAGTPRGVARNRVSALADGGAASNVAEAVLTVRDELFGRINTIVGEVLDGGCGEENAAGMEGLRVFLEDGSYAMTDARGRFHFEGVRPGTHVVQLDAASIPEGYELAACNDHNRFAGRGYSQFIDLAPGTLWRADFRLQRIPPPEGALSLAIAASLARESMATVTLDINVLNVPLQNFRLSVILPEGGNYVPGTATLGGEALADPQQADGVVTFRLGDRPADWRQTLTLGVALDRNRTRHELQALATFNTSAGKNQRTPPIAASVTTRAMAPSVTMRLGFESYSATLGEQDREEVRRAAHRLNLDNPGVTLRIVGHTDDRPVRAGDTARFADNQSLSEARARTVAAQLVEELGLPAARIEIAGRGAEEPVADNATAVGRARNRRVEIFLLQPAVETAHSGAPEHVEVATRGEAPGGRVAAADEAPADDNNYAPYAANVDGAFLATLTPGATELLWPPGDANPPIDAIKIAVQHAPGAKVEVSVNGKPVPATNLAGVYKASGIAVVEYAGVPVEVGDNRIDVKVDGERLERTVHYSGPAVRGELVPELSRLVADGKQPPVIAIRLFDRWGKPVRARMLGRYNVAAPYMSYTEREELQQRQLFATGAREQSYLVGQDGVAYIRLAPTTTSGAALVTLQFDERRTQEVRAWLEPEARDWILVGLAEGTVGYNKVSGNMESAAAGGSEDDLHDEGRVAFYAKGRIKGEYLLTMAYDTANGATAGGNRLEQQINPDEYYLVYGDASEQRQDAASIRKLYIKIERGQFYALFGDYDTGLNVTELARYTRRMNGLKSEYHGEQLSYAAFAAENAQAFVKDEMQGDGTSGLYRLSRAPLMINSESVRLETRDRFRSDVILSSESLARNLDYTIDYFDGTLFFKRPVPSRDENFNPVFIVVDYEIESAGDDGVSGGGRVAYRVTQDVEIGLTAINEDVANAAGRLAGLDARMQLGTSTELKAEVAASESSASGLDRDGGGYRVEVRHQGEHLAGRAYVSETESGFGLGQQSGAELGTQKQGVEGQYRFSEKLGVFATAWRQENLETDASREVVESALRYTETERSATLGLRRAADEFAAGAENVSEQAFIGGSLKLTDKLGVHASAETGLGSRGESADYPDRLLLGADYALTTHATLFAEQEVARGAELDADMTRIGVRTQPWERARFDSALEQHYGEYGPRTFATVGLAQGWQVSEDLLLDVGLDRVQSLQSPDYRDIDTDTPAASGGSEDFTAAWLGATYNDKDWTWTGRLERRVADSERRWGIFAGAFGQYSEALSLSLSLFHVETDREAGVDETHSDLRFGLAWRPTQAEWILLNRSDLIFDDLRNPLDIQSTAKFVNNLNANWQISDRWQLGLLHGMKYTRADFGEEYTGVTQLYGAEMRYDIDEHWDVGAHGSALHSLRSETLEHSYGVSLGRDLFTNVWVSVGYNFAGFEDEDFSAARYTARGVFIRFRIKFDQDSIADMQKSFRRTAVAPRDAAGSEARP